MKTEKELEKSGGKPRATNNQMELQAVIEGLASLKEPCRVHLYSDSKYVLQGMKEWMAGWKRRGWQRREKGRSVPVKNVDLWKSLDEKMQVHQIEFNYVAGHSGHIENERCDELAVAARRRYESKR